MENKNVISDPKEKATILNDFFTEQIIWILEVRHYLLWILSKLASFFLQL